MINRGKLLLALVSAMFVAQVFTAYQLVQIRWELPSPTSPSCSSHSPCVVELSSYSINSIKGR
jgi:hypothetical protein